MSLVNGRGQGLAPFTRMTRRPWKSSGFTLVISGVYTVIKPTPGQVSGMTINSSTGLAASLILRDAAPGQDADNAPIVGTVNFTAVGIDSKHVNFAGVGASGVEFKYGLQVSSTETCAINVFYK